MAWLDDLGKFIQAVGFPVAAAVAMFLQNSKFQKSIDEMREAIQELKNAITDKRNR